VTGVTIDDNDLVSTASIPGGAPIYIGTNDGHDVSDLDITNNTITTVTGGIGIKVGVDTAGTASIIRLARRYVRRFRHRYDQRRDDH
jgi:hypothetical protein